jgi:hypothetical protein
MRALYFSTVFRYAPNDKAGELVKLDWDNKRIINKVFVGPKTMTIEDPNPRGNSRGGRGVVIVDGKVIVASYCELQVYDLELNHLYNITHPLMAGLHEIYTVNNHLLWLASTTLDCALLFDLNTEEVVQSIWPREMPSFQSHWNLKPLEIDKNADNRLKFIGMSEGKNPNHIHLNALATWNNDVYGLINRFGAIVNLTKGSILVEDKALWGCHNLRFLDDGTVFFNDTRNQGVSVFDKQGKFIKRINLLPFHPVGKKVNNYKKVASARKLLENLGLLKQATVMPFYVRGLDVVGDLLFVGMSPAAILCINWQSEKLIDTFDYSSDSRIAIHGLKVFN